MYAYVIRTRAVHLALAFVTHDSGTFARNETILFSACSSDAGQSDADSLPDPGAASLALNTLSGSKSKREGALQEVCPPGMLHMEMAILLAAVDTKSVGLLNCLSQ